MVSQPSMSYGPPPPGRVVIQGPAGSSVSLGERVIPVPVAVAPGVGAGIVAPGSLGVGGVVPAAGAGIGTGAVVGRPVVSGLLTDVLAGSPNALAGGQRTGGLITSLLGGGNIAGSDTGLLNELLGGTKEAYSPDGKVLKKTSGLLDNVLNGQRGLTNLL